MNVSYHLPVYRRIFRSRLKSDLSDNEHVVVDKIYQEEKCTTPRSEQITLKRFNSNICARHETVNRRFKCFSVLGIKSRNDVSRHHVVFFAVLNIVHLSNEHGTGLGLLYFQ